MKGLCDQSSPPNEVGRIAQHVRKREESKGKRKGCDGIISPVRLDHRDGIRNLI